MHDAAADQARKQADEILRLVRFVAGQGKAACVPVVFESDTVRLGAGKTAGQGFSQAAYAAAVADGLLVEKSGADCVIATDAGCLMNIAGRLRRLGSRVRALHLAQVLASTGPNQG